LLVFLALICAFLQKKKLKNKISQSGGVLLKSIMLSKLRRFVALVSVIALLILCIPITAVAAEDDLTEPTNMVAVNNIPVILYHRVVNTATNQWTDTSLKKFKAHIEYLKDNGYTTLSSEEYVKILKGEEAPPEKPILLTFDDATPDFYTTVLPILEENSMKCVLFVVEDFIGGYGMSETQLKDIADNHPNVSIESHTKSHDQSVWTNSISYDDAKAELEAAKEYIKGITGKDPVLLAYPYGNSSLGARVAAAETGIQYAFKVGYPNEGAYMMGRHYTLDITVKEFASNIGGPVPTKDYGDEDDNTSIVIYHETFENGIEIAKQSGGASLTQVTGKTFDRNEDGAALYVSNRTNNWDAADFMFDDIGLEEGKTYTVIVTGYIDSDVTVPEGANVQLQPVGSGYGWIDGKPMVAGQAFILSGTYTVDSEQHNRLRVQSNDAGATIPFYVGDILITAEQSEPVIGEAYHETFENGIGDVVQAGPAIVTHVTDKIFEGNDDGAAIYVSGRSQNWHGVDLPYSAIGLEKGKEYIVKVTGYVDGDVVIPEGSQAWIQTVDNYAYTTGSNLVAGQPFVIQGNITVDDGDRAIRILTNEVAANIPFYIGDIVITAVQSEPAEPVTREVYHETFENGKGVAVQSGGANLTQVTEKVFAGNDDGAALYVSNRTNNWDAADFMFADIGLVDGITFTITVTGYIDSDVTVPEGANVQLQPVGANDFGWINGCSKPMVAGEAFAFTGTYKVDGSKHDRLRVQSNEAGKTVPFYIGDILITTDDPAYAKPFTTITFEGDQGTGGFVGRGGNEILTVTDEANHTEGGSKALKVEGREQAWQGPSLEVTEYISQGSEYKVTAWVKLIQPEVAILQLSTQIGGSTYINLQSKTVRASDDWVMLEGTYRYTNMSSNFASIYVESTNSATASFYIDDISFVPTGSGPLDIERDLTPIKDVYEDYFLIGNAISEVDLSGIRLELLKMHHNVITAENAMKPEVLQPTKGNFNFADADNLVNTSIAEGMKVHGHTLVWHSQTPDWMTRNEDGEYLSREEALENMRTHIRTVMEHFGDRVISWDVLNEAMNDNPQNPTDWRGALRRSPWYYAIGPDYVEYAFRYAREVLDEHPDWDVKLYYNDYNDDNQNKSIAIYSMVKELNEKYAQEHPGKLLIDGIGMQAHYNLSTNPENVRLSLERFLSIPGVEVSVTELDIMAGSNRQLSADQAKAQAYLYAKLFQIYKEHADRIPRVTFWGLDDGRSWRSENNPLLFNSSLKAKPAYYAVIDPDKYIEENPPEEPEDAMQSEAKYGTPVIDGVIDSIWSSAPTLQVNRYQMAWQGATGTAKVLWDDSNLYVLVEVRDDQLNKANANAWEQDSIEVFVDENNGKTSYYEADDGQYRVNYDNETSFNPESIAEGFESATAVNGTNYVVEVKIPFRTITPADNVKIGFDVQINDAKDGARISVANWNDLSGNGYQDTSVFGILTLTGKNTGGSGGSGGSGSGIVVNLDKAPVETDYNAENGEVTVKVPVVTNADGSTTADVTADYIEALVESIKEHDEGSTIRIELDTTADDVTAKLPADALSKILAADPEATIVIAVGEYELVFDSKALEAISEAGSGSVEINISSVDADEIAEISPEAAEKIGDRPVYSMTVTIGGKTVSDFNGGTLTVSIPYTLAEGEDPNAVLIYYIDDDNNLIPMVSRYTDGAVEFTTTHLSKYAVGYNKVSFNDVKPSDYYYAPAIFFGARGVIEAGDLEPKTVLTRGEAIVLIMKAYGIEPLEDAEDNFSDAEGPYAGYFAKAKAIGLTKGIGNNMVGADVPMTREMMFTLIYNILDIMGELPETDVIAKDPTSFSDYSELSDWAVEATSALIEKGIIEGTGNNTLSPKATAVRAEMLTILYRLLNK